MNQQYTNNQLQRLFLQQSCIDAWTEYTHQINSQRAIVWDYIVLTASNEEQADVYRREIDYRLRCGQLPSRTKYLVIPDPEGKRVGSGGATLNVLKEIAWKEQKDESNFFKGLRILVIHSGGDSKRIPQYSTCGKLFSPVPRVLPNGQASTLFDEFMISTSMIPARMQDGMLVMSGDVLLLFNALQIDTQFHGAAAISIKEDVETGKNHGVFLGDEEENVSRFLHKQSVKKLEEWGAVNRRHQVNLDTGAILVDCDMVESLYSLISTDNVIDEKKFDTFVNEKARISFYGDFLYPLATQSTLQDYQKEAPEGEFCEELTDCREKIWEVLHQYQLKLICLSPAEFIHFGTTRELRQLVTKTVNDYSFLGWEHVVASNHYQKAAEYALHNTFVDRDVVIEPDVYVENSFLSQGVSLKKGAVISGLLLPEGMIAAENTVYHGLKLKNGNFVVRCYGVEDNPKGTMEDAGTFLGVTLKDFLMNAKVAPEDLWDILGCISDNQDNSLWKAKLYPVCDTIEEGIAFAQILVKAAGGMASEAELEQWKGKKRLSLYESFNCADGNAIIPWRENLEDMIRVERFVEQMLKDVPVREALDVFSGGMRKTEQKLLLERMKKAEFSEKIRVYYGLAKAAEWKRGDFQQADAENYMQSCFGAIQTEISEYVTKRLGVGASHHIAKEEVNVKLPVRVNWGGGWTDTPPYCNEHGGVVLNAAISLKGNLPIQVTIRRLPEYVIELESQDIGAHGIFASMEEVNDCSNPYDKFALHKAALIACGVIRLGDTRKLEDILKELGGGVYLSTQVMNVPKGSGLGTSSILSGACVKGLYEFFGEKVNDDVLYDIVLCMEQLMSTGGGWQDQVGGITPGMKLITTKPGIQQKIEVEPVDITPENRKELQERFALVYTGQRRLARNLLRDVVGGYIGNRPESIQALNEMKRVAALMKFELEQGDIDSFARLLNRHWELSIQLDAGSTNTCIDQIFLSIEDLIDGKFISGAGGGGFLQVILKKGVTRKMLSERLYSIFQDSGVDVWECDFI